MTSIATIRELEPGDSLLELTLMLHAAYAPLGAMGLNYTAVDQNEDVTRRRIDGGICLVAESDGKLVGTIAYKRPGVSQSCPHFAQQNVAVIGQFAVSRAFQKHGLGSKLLTAAEQLARKDRATELALDTAENARNLIAWYMIRAYRFIEYAQWDGKSYRSVIMSKIL
jgi:GNAT superfamily N-acetyltransferase